MIFQSGIWDWIFLRTWFRYCCNCLLIRFKRMLLSKWLDERVWSRRFLLLPIWCYPSELHGSQSKMWKYEWYIPADWLYGRSGIFQWDFGEKVSNFDRESRENINAWYRTWIQAEYKGLKGSKRWKDWNNKKLKNIAWYDSINDSQDEPTKVIFNHFLS